MAKPTPRQVAKKIAAATKELQDEGALDEWGAAFGLALAQNVLRRAQARVKDHPIKEAAE